MLIERRERALRPMKRARMAALAALTASGVAAASAAAYRPPVAPFKVGDPGVLHADGRWNVLATGSWSRPGEISTAARATGPWTLSPTHLLTRRPAWASVRNHSVWAPSEAKVGNQYVVFYAAVINGERSKRCNGTGVASSPTGPFVPRDRPISCVAGHGAPDPEPGVAAVNSTIDATPSWVTIGGRRRLYLTYKTQRRKADGHYFSTIRMVRLNPADGANSVLHRSHRLTVRPDNIEENPVLVQRGRTFTLFTSLGGYTLCSYHTEWRQSTRLWRWPQASHRLAFPANAHTCGQGDAQVVRGLPEGSWRIFYSGRYPTRPSSFKLYVGKLAWPGGRPAVTALL
jgi:hypothetical protein